MKKQLFFNLLFVFTGLGLFAQNAERNWSAKTQTSKSFIENKGQFPNVNNAKIEYAIDNSGTKIYFSSTGLTYAFFKSMPKNEEKSERERERGKSETEREREEHQSNIKIDYIHLIWENANPNTKIIADEETNDYFSYALRNGQEVTNINFVKGYKKITYKNLYPNIDVEYTFHPTEGIKYAIILRPGADIYQLKMNY